MTADKRCPSFDDLLAFSLGKAASQAWEVLAEHISTCAECAARLRTAGPDDDDSVILNLRRLATQGPPGQTSPRGGAREPPTAADRPNQESQGDTPPDPPVPPAQVGSYQILEQIGKGGMGVVYRARQIYLNRVVALKLVSVGANLGPRFQVEGKAVARLQHPNVVQVYEFNVHEGQPYLAMEYLEGGSLARKLNGRPLPERDAAALVQTLAVAVQAAHECQILHRDLKPANVLLAADGTPKLGDFGLAKLLDEDEGQTATGAVMGTASYMAPEQADGRLQDIGPRTDVYALGAILYETLTGRPPFRRRTRGLTLEDVSSREPVAPARWRRGLAPDLEAVCLKCLAKEPGQRYPSAQALADDLGRWLEGRPTFARPLGRLARWRKAARRHPWRAALAAAVALAGMALSVTWYCLRPERLAEQIEAQLDHGEPVTLIGETGKPCWSRWCLGGDGAQLALAKDQVFSLRNTQGIALLELARRPPRGRFRLRAEVRHDLDQNNWGDVGLFVGHHEFAAGPGAVHFFVQLAYNDIKDDMKVYEVVKKKDPRAKPPPGNRVDLYQRVYSQDNPSFHCDGRILGFQAAAFKPAVRRGDRWRRLAITVTPEAIRARWEDQEPEEQRSLGFMLRKDRDFLAGRQQPILEATLGNRLDSGLFAQGSLGLYVFNGSASFRRVVVEPLGADD